MSNREQVVNQPGSKRPTNIILGLFLLGGFVAFSNIINSYFLSDDFAQIGKILGGDLPDR